MAVHDLRTCGELIKQINDELQKNANNALRSSDMTMAQLGALMELNRCAEKQLTLKELEHQLHIAQSTAAGIISRLEQKGLVEGFGDAKDKRIKLVKITPKGIECVADAVQGMSRAEDALLSRLTETEKSIFFSLLKKVRESLL